MTQEINKTYNQWIITFYDRYECESFNINVIGNYDNEDDAIKEAIYQNNIYVDYSDNDKMYFNQNEIFIIDAYQKAFTLTNNKF